MGQLHPQPLVNWVKPQRKRKWNIGQSINHPSNYATWLFKCHIRGDEDIFILPLWSFLLGRLMWGDALHTSLFLSYFALRSFYSSQEHITKTIKLYTVCVFSLCWIPRHSPKVVKAASQVLNSMWQYRDLRSLYKKVKPAWLHVLWLYSHWKMSVM